MANNLTVSSVDRQNILNNPYAVEEIKKSIGVKGIEYNGRIVVIKEQIADFFEVTPRTIDNYIAHNEKELKDNGYEVLRGNSLKTIKLAINEQYVNEMYFANIKMVPQLGVFDFRALLRWKTSVIILLQEKSRKISFMTSFMPLSMRHSMMMKN